MSDKELLIIEDARKERNQKLAWMERFYILNAWMQQINKNVTMCDLLKRKEIKKFIVYGTEEIGLRFIDRCINEKIDIFAITDRSIKEGGYRYKNIPMISVEEMRKATASEEVMIIITLAGNYAETEIELRDIKNIIFLRELFDE